MVYVKSVLAGIAAMIVAALIVVLYLLYEVSGIWGGYVGLDLSAILCVLILVFAGGFWWQYRRAR